MIALVSTDNELCDPDAMDPLIKAPSKPVVPTPATLTLVLNRLLLSKRLGIFVNFKGQEVQPPNFLRDQLRSLLWPELDDDVVKLQ